MAESQKRRENDNWLDHADFIEMISDMEELLVVYLYSDVALIIQCYPMSSLFDSKQAIVVFLL